MAYVYIYYDPRKTPVEPIYVGKGKGKRILFHKTRAKNPILKRKLDKIKALNLEPIIEKYSDNLFDEDALSLEIELIKKYGRIDLGTGTLCNLTDGGETTFGWKPSNETKKLWSEQRKGKKQTEAQYKANCERKVSEERKKYLSEIMKGIDRLNNEQRKLIILKNTGSKRSKETKELFSKQRKGKQLGSNNPAAIEVDIFNDNNELMFHCYGNFDYICEKNNLPRAALNNSYINNGKKIYVGKSTPKYIMNKNKNFIGWCAIKLR